MVSLEDDALLDVAVLCGGNSPERDVSMRSGRSVADALSAVGHAVALFDPSDVDLFGVNWRQFDACFVALHGGAGENGQVQIDLEELGVPYTCSGPVASRLAMSKTATKDRLRQFNLPTLPALTFQVGCPQAAAGVARLGYPVVIKPDSHGSSLGVSVAQQRDEFSASVAKAGRYEAFLLAEPMIRGREFTVAVLQREPLPVIEIVHDEAIFDYAAKYETGAAQIRFPEDDHARSVEALATEAAAALGTRGLVRVDIAMDEGDQPWILEVNTVPGMTARSLAPQAAAKAGIGFEELCDRLVRQCIGVKVLEGIA